MDKDSSISNWELFRWFIYAFLSAVAFKICDMDKDGYISNGELFHWFTYAFLFTVAFKICDIDKDSYMSNGELFLWFTDAFLCAVAFKIYDMDKDGYISNGELFQVLKMMVGNNLKDTQLQQIVDKTIIHADTDGDGKISFEEFCAVSGMLEIK